MVVVKLWFNPISAVAVGIWVQNNGQTAGDDWQSSLLFAMSSNTPRQTCGDSRRDLTPNNKRIFSFMFSRNLSCLGYLAQTKTQFSALNKKKISSEKQANILLAVIKKISLNEFIKIRCDILGYKLLGVVFDRCV